MPGIEEVASPDAPTITNEKGGAQSHIPVRFDLIDGNALFEMAAVLHEGAEKYGPSNWRKIPVEDHLNHLVMHAYAYLAGDRSDKHLSHIMCRATFAQAVALTDQDQDKVNGAISLPLAQDPAVPLCKRPKLGLFGVVKDCGFPEDHAIHRYGYDVPGTHPFAPEVRPYADPRGDLTKRVIDLTMVTANTCGAGICVGGEWLWCTQKPGHETKYHGKTGTNNGWRRKTDRDSSKKRPSPWDLDPEALAEYKRRQLADNQRRK